MDRQQHKKIYRCDYPELTLVQEGKKISYYSIISRSLQDLFVPDVIIQIVCEFTGGKNISSSIWTVNLHNLCVPDSDELDCNTGGCGCECDHDRDYTEYYLNSWYYRFKNQPLAPGDIIITKPLGFKIYTGSIFLNLYWDGRRNKSGLSKLFNVLTPAYPDLFHFDITYQHKQLGVITFKQGCVDLKPYRKELLKNSALKNNKYNEHDWHSHFIYYDDWTDTSHKILVIKSDIDEYFTYPEIRYLDVMTEILGDVIKTPFYKIFNSASGNSYNGTYLIKTT